MINFSAAPSLLQDFHFVRPWWLLAIVPAIFVGWSLKYLKKSQSLWKNFIDPLLLAPLLKGKVNQPGNIFPLITILFWTLGILAIAGPTWQKLPQPVRKLDNALVILLDLSPSMLAADVKPARLIAARHKIIDLLNARQEGYTALIAYSGDAHIVAPLTDDNKTIINLVNILEPAIMPIDGSNLEDALQKALQLFKNSGYENGDILLFTDGITEQAEQNSSAILAGTTFTLSIIGIGTEAGAPIPSTQGGFIKDNDGNIVMPSLDSAMLQTLANHVHGTYTELQLGDQDIAPLVKGTQRADQQKTTSIKREFDQWQDMGALLAWPLLILLLPVFRRGILFSFMFMIPLLQTPPAQAEDSLWEKLWLNDNQRAMKSMEKKDYETAAKNFDDPDWKAAAQYESQNYSEAFKHFEKNKTANGYYNTGNALAKSGQLSDAISAYNQAINLNADFEDAKINRTLAQKALEKQKKSVDPEKQGDHSGNKPGNENDSDQGEKSCAPQTDDCHQNDNNQPDQDINNAPSSAQENPRKQTAHNENNAEKADVEATPTEKNPESSSDISSLGKEQEQAMEQWLRKVPDDPDILLRNKFQYYYQEQLQQQRLGKSPSHLNTEERW